MTTSAPFSTAPNPWIDSPRRYGRISRLLHWSMALLFLWQFIGMGLKITLHWSPRDSWILSTHAHVGFVLLVLMMLRAVWALANRRQRPSHGVGWAARGAAIGHFLLYLLMFATPAVALVRQYGAGREFALFNWLPIIPAHTPDPALVQWVNGTKASLGFTLHGALAWVLLALIVGHIAMVIVHHFMWKDDTLHKMAGPRLQ